MFIVWGSKGYKEELGTYTHSTVECGHCHNDVNVNIVEVGKKFTLFFIPLFKTSSSYYLTCPICTAGLEISKEEAQNYIDIISQVNE